MVDNTDREQLTDEVAQPRRKAEGFGAEPAEAVAFGARIKKFALPGVLVASVTAGLLFGGLTPQRPGNDKALTAVPAAQEVAPAAPRVDEQVSRSQERPEIAPEPEAALPPQQFGQLTQIQAESPSPSSSKATSSAAAKGTRYATEAVNVRAEASASSEKIGEVAKGEQVSITGEESKGFTQVVVKGRNGWISSEFLSKNAPAAGASKSDGKSTEKPSASASKSTTAPKTSAPAGSANCPSLPGVRANTHKVQQTVCAKFGSGIYAYHGVRPDWDVEHPSGRAVDFMIRDNSTGWAIANYVRANAGSLGVTEVIFDQKIWTTQRSSEGWRMMSDRGSATANHRDHVHVSTR